MNRINRTRVIGQWPALAHLCAMEEEEGVRGPKTISAEAAFWALRNGTALKPEPEQKPESKPPTTPRIRRVVTEPGAPVKTIAAPKPQPTPKPQPIQQKNARLRAALLPNARLAVPKDIDYTGMEDWADETAIQEDCYSD